MSFARENLSLQVREYVNLWSMIFFSRKREISFPESFVPSVLFCNFDVCREYVEFDTCFTYLSKTIII